MPLYETGLAAPDTPATRADGHDRAARLVGASIQIIADTRAVGCQIQILIDARRRCLIRPTVAA
jgi:hypothetical protein